MIAERVIFDANDIDYLTVYLSSEQLKREIHHADNQVGVAKIFGEDAQESYWLDFKESCELALDIRKSAQAKERIGKSSISILAVKETNDIADVISRYTRLRKYGKRLRGLCPLHNDKEPSLIVYPDQQKWHCFGACNTGGDVVDFIKLAENLDTSGAITRLRGRNQ